jgi:hypothetical protein
MLSKCLDCKREIDKRAKRCCKCYHKHQIGSENGNYKQGKYIRNECIDCKKKVDPRAKRCKSCAAQYKWKVSIGLIHRNQTGNKNPNWIDGRSYEPYPLEFTEELKDKIRQRDNYTCQNCGMTEEEHLIVIGQVLHVHHIDYDKTNCKKENLLSLCSSCNTRANYNRTYWQKFYKGKIQCLQK